MRTYLSGFCAVSRDGTDRVRAYTPFVSNVLLQQKNPKLIWRLSKGSICLIVLDSS